MKSDYLRDVGISMWPDVTVCVCVYMDMKNYPSDNNNLSSVNKRNREN